MGDLQWEKEEFIHVLIKFYAVLEECMPVEKNLRKILMMLEEKSHFGEGLWNGPSRTLFPDISINLLKLPSSQGIVGEKSFVASR